MNFCGTIALNRRMKIRGFGMHCDALAHMLYDAQKHHGVDKTPAGDQYRLFQLDNEQRAKFGKFALTLRLLTTDFPEHDEAYWKMYADTDFNDYEFFQMLENHSAEAQPIIASLEKVAGGEILTEVEYEAAKKFLRMLAARGHAAADDLDGGCF